jgi:hypothetical protein
MSRAIPMPPAMVCERCRNILRAVVIETKGIGYSLTYSCSRCGAIKVKTMALPADESVKLFKTMH